MITIVQFLPILSAEHSIVQTWQNFSYDVDTLFTIPLYETIEICVKKLCDRKRKFKGSFKQQSREQRAESRAQRAESRAQRTESREKKEESREQRAERREQRVESRE